jgi:hypothetical protein
MSVRVHREPVLPRNEGKTVVLSVAELVEARRAAAVGALMSVHRAHPAALAGLTLEQLESLARQLAFDRRREED